MPLFLYREKNIKRIIALSLIALVPASIASAAYPQTKPRAGEVCKKIDRGIRTKASNGKLVVCVKSGSYSRWKAIH